MAEFRKKPVVIEAFQWTGGREQLEDPIWIVEAIRDGAVEITGSGDDLRMEILATEGRISARPGYWIVRETDGAIWLKHPKAFAAEYEGIGFEPWGLRIHLDTGATMLLTYDTEAEAREISSSLNGVIPLMPIKHAAGEVSFLMSRLIAWDVIPLGQPVPAPPPLANISTPKPEPKPKRTTR